MTSLEHEKEQQQIIAPGGKMASAEPLGRLVLTYVAERGGKKELRPGSVRTVRYTLGTLVQVVGWDTPIVRLRRSHIEQWMGRGGLAPASLRSQLSIVRRFCRWALERGHLRKDPTVGLSSPRQPRYLPRGLPRPKVTASLMSTPDARAALVLTLMVQEGLRCCEVAALELGDIDPDERLLLIRGKGGHERVLPITVETWSAMLRYLTEYPASAGPLVRSYRRPNEGICAKYISRLVSGWLHEAGVEASAHALRHTAATDMLRAGAHVRDVQQALGHQSLATTQRYMPWVVKDLRTAMEGRQYAAPPVVSGHTGDDAA